MQRLLPLLLVLGACSDPELEMRVAQLETELKQLKEQGVKPAAAAQAPGAVKPAAAPAGGASDERKQAAIALFKEGNALVAAGNYDGARTKLNQLTAEYGDTPAAGSAKKVLAEIEIIGKPAGALAVEQWYQGEVAVDPNKVTLFVFWEVWCPHCKREVPKMEAMHTNWGPKGVSVIGLTKQTRNITDEQVKSFISEKSVTYPMAKEADGAMSRAYNVSGIPAAAAIKNGKVLWRGHPGRITEDMLKKWTGS